MRLIWAQRCIDNSEQRVRACPQDASPTRFRRPAAWQCICWLSLLLVLYYPAPKAQSSAARQATDIPEAAATEGAATSYPYPLIDAAKKISGQALVEALRKGGYVLYMRHTETGTVTKECTESNLTRRGARDAARVGTALRTLKVPLDRILSSAACRVQDTARMLGLGRFDVVDGLGNMPARDGHDFHAEREILLGTPPARGKNTLLVSHMQGGKDTSQALYLDFGETIILLPAPNGVRVAVARLRVDDWAALIAGDAG